MNLVILAASVVLWAAVHSWLASPRMKDLATRALGGRMLRLYRLAYNAFALISFVPVLVLARVLPDHPLYAIPAPWRYIMLAGQAGAAVCLVIALLRTDALHFAGLRQLVGEPQNSSLNTRGFYALVRHPLYLFGLLILWLTPMMTLNVLTVFIVLSIYLFVGAGFEERRLLSEFGMKYEEYRRRTPMIVPRLRKAPRLPHPAGSDTDR